MQVECYRIQLQLDQEVETIHWQDCKVAPLLKLKIRQSDHHRSLHPNHRPQKATDRSNQWDQQANTFFR